MTVYYRAQFQTSDGRTHAVVDTEPITVHRLAVVQVLLERKIEIGANDLPPLIDLSVTPPAYLQAAEMALSRSA